MRDEQRFVALAQSPGIAALAMEPVGALNDWLGEREGKQGFFVRGSHGMS